MKKIAIIGGGISGLSALHSIRTGPLADCDVRLYEKSDRLGGTIGTDRELGFVSDWGPNGFLDKIPLTLQLVEQLGLTDQLDPADPSAENRFIYRNKKLHAISASPLKFLASPLLSLKGRLRLIVEPLIKAKTDDSDESIYDFARRRIGPEAADTLIGPMVSGIFGGDARELSLKSCFPVMVEMESQYGSLFKAMIAKKKAKKGGGPAGPSGRLTSFKNGLYTLIERFGELYAQNIETGKATTTITKTDTGYRITFADGSTADADAVICAAPAFAAGEMVGSLDSSLSDLLNSIPYASISVVCLGYPCDKISHPLGGFGFLVPRTEGKRILGSIWTSAIFGGRSPDGMVQVRAMIGGATDPGAVNLSDGELLDIIFAELDEIIGTTGRPSYVKIYRYTEGIPQFVIGHSKKIARLNEFEHTYPGLFFAGNAYEGVGLNDCVLRANSVVTRLADMRG